MIRIHPISGNKKQYLDLLLLADEQESMIDRYLERGEMFILSDNDTVKASCVITCEDKGIYEIKSIAVYPSMKAADLHTHTEYPISLSIITTTPYLKVASN